MPTVPQVKSLAENVNSVDIMNAIRSDASSGYQAAVPLAADTVESIKEIGQVILQNEDLRNEFLHALYNRIGMVIITSKLYSNPWSMFKRGILELGEVVEEIFVNLAKPHQFNPTLAETNLYRREFPDVQAAFHRLNYQKFYKTTVSRDELRQAFLSWNGLDDLISRIVQALYTSAAYDEFVVMKYMLARLALDGKIHPVTVAAISNPATKDELETVIGTVKGISNSLTFMSPNYNMAHVQNFSNKDDQFLIVSAAFDGMVDVKVLAAAFNMDRAEFMGHRVMVDSFAMQDDQRLAELFANEPNYTPFTSAEKAELENIGAILVDRDFFMIFDNLLEAGEKYNPEGRYWNYWLHVWQIFSASPFANAAVFTSTENTVASLTVLPAAPTVRVGRAQQFAVDAEFTGFGGQSVLWSVSGNQSNQTTINSSGLLSVATDETAATLTVTATSTITPTVKATTTVTVSQG